MIEGNGNCFIEGEYKYNRLRRYTGEGCYLKVLDGPDFSYQSKKEWLPRRRRRTGSAGLLIGVRGRRAIGLIVVPLSRPELFRSPVFSG
jgi:hypothetical protein